LPFFHKPRKHCLLLRFSSATEIFWYYLQKEVHELFIGKKLSAEEKRKRRQCFLGLWKNGKMSLYTGDEAEQVAKKELKELYQMEQKDEFSVNPANPGKARGIARILHATHM
jgi:hypothetical protein